MRDINNLSFISKVRKELILLNKAIPDFSILEHEMTFTFGEVLMFLKEFDRIQSKLEIYEPYDAGEEV
jgi:hypothetical protein